MPSAQTPMPSKDALQRLIDGLQTLIREHLALARAELKEDVRSVGRDAVVGAAGVPALLAGYLLLMMALGFLLSLWMPTWAGLGIIALLNLGAGGAVTYAGIRKVMRGRVDLRRTGEELQRDRQWLASLKEPPRAAGDGQMQPPAPSTNLVPPAQPPHRNAVPAGKAGSTAGATGSLGPRSPSPSRQPPEAGASSPPDGSTAVH